MERNSLSEKEKIRVLTLNDDSNVSFSRLRRTHISRKKSKYRLLTTCLQIQYPTTNGFRYSELNFPPLLPEPNIVLQSFSISDDFHHEFVLKAKFVYNKLGLELQRNGYSIESANIIEAVFFDNETEIEFTFDIEINLSNNVTFDQLIKLEDEIFDKLEDELFAEFKDEVIEFNFSLYSKEE